MTPESDIAVDVVIPTFNRRADLLVTLEALAAQTWPGDRLHVFVVDNGSTDGTEAALADTARRWPFALRHVRNEPRGPAHGRNVGAALGKSAFIAFVDSDISLAPDWIAGAVAAAQAGPGIGAVGGKVVYDHCPEILNAFGGELSAIGLAWDSLEGEPIEAAGAAAERIWMNCSASLVRRAAFQEIGGFDSAFFYGYEDSDLGWRLLLAGWRSIVRPELVCRHRVGRGAGLAAPVLVFHYAKNRLRSVLRNCGARRMPRMLAGYLLYSLADIALRSSRGAKLRALSWNLRHIAQTLALRRLTQAGRRADESQVAALFNPRWFPPQPLGGLRRRVLPGEAKGAPVADDRVVSP